MSECIYNNTNTAGAQEMNEDGEEMTIYANSDITNGHDLQTEANSDRRNNQLTGTEAAKNTSYRAATVCLGLLCFFLLVVIVVLCVLLILKTNQFQINSKNLIQDRDQLLTKTEALTTERDSLILMNQNMTNERNELISKNNNLIKQRDQLNQEKSDMWKPSREMDEWIYYRFFFYYISSETKSWNESRQDCLQRGADLVIINDREKQEFVTKVTGGNGVWIGLTDSAEEGMWRWVDDITVSSGFWRAGEPNSYLVDEDCVVSMTSGWVDYPCYNAFKWICEKRIHK